MIAVAGVLREWPTTSPAQIVALVVGGDDDRRIHRGPSERIVEICSETSPTRKMTTASTISSTDELVMCVLRDRRPHGVGRAEGERGAGDRQEDAQRAEDGDDLEQDQQEPRAVGDELDLRLAEPRRDVIGSNRTL